MQFQDKDPNRNPDPQQQPPQPDWRKWIWPGLLVLMLVLAVMQSPAVLGNANQGTTIEYSLFREEIQRDNVNQVIFEGNTARGTFNSPVPVEINATSRLMVTQFVTNLPSFEDVELIALLSTYGVEYTFNPPQTNPILFLLFNLGPFILLIVFFIWMARRTQGQMTNIFGFGRSLAKEYNPEMPRVTFEDVAGQDAAKGELEEVVDFLRDPDKYIALGARVPKGVLLVGPPGTGKTLLARAVAGEANVAFFSMAASEFVEMFVGVGASRVRDLFNRAKASAPSIVFIDELDAVGRHRGAGLGGGHDEREQTLNQLLAEMDGFEQGISVIIVAATNRPDVLDPALLRPGRFDRQITVDLPDRAGRLSILKIHTRDKPVDKSVDLEALAKAAVGFSGADLANLANEAALSAARNSRKKIIMGDFSYAFERIILGTERPPLSNPEERRVVAYHESGHALVAMLTPESDRVLKVTITPRGQALGITAFMPEDDRRNYPRKYLEARLKVGLGGRAAEELAIGEITTGASNDLRQVTELARRMVTQFGMSDRVGPINFGDHDQQPFLGYTISQGRSYSEETAAQIDAEVRRLVEEAHQQTVELLAQHRKALDSLAKELMENEVIEHDRVAEILEIYQQENAANGVKDQSAAPTQPEEMPGD